MNKLIVFILIINVSAFVFFSCQDTDSDGQAPFINRETISFKDGDTFIISPYNLNLFSIDLSDNDALSNLKLQLVCPTDTMAIAYKRDTVTGERLTTIDSMPLLKKVYRWNLYYQQEVNITDSFSVQISTAYLSKSYPVRAGSYYDLIVGCVDRAGNYDSVIIRNITLVYHPDLIKKSDEEDNDDGDDDDNEDPEEDEDEDEENPDPDESEE